MTRTADSADLIAYARTWTASHSNEDYTFTIYEEDHKESKTFWVIAVSSRDRSPVVFAQSFWVAGYFAGCTTDPKVIDVTPATPMPRKIRRALDGMAA